MKVPHVPKARRPAADPVPGTSAIARLDRRTKNLTKRLSRGDIAIIDHVDLDRVSAEALVACGVGAVVNVAVSISGRYPNLGPKLLIDAGVPLIDDVGPDVFAKVTEGARVRVDGETIYLDDQVVAKGTLQSADSVAAAMAEATDRGPRLSLSRGHSGAAPVYPRVPASHDRC